MTEARTGPAGRTGTEMRERRRRRVAANLERIALQLFIERGFDNVSVDEIAAAADISRRTFFRYFSGKNDILFGLFGDSRRYEQDVLAAWHATAESSALLSLHEAIISVAQASTPDVEVLRLRSRMLRQETSKLGDAIQHGTSFAHHLTDRLAERMGAKPGDIRPALFVHVSLTAVQTAMLHWTTSPRTEPLDQAIARALAITREGLSRGSSGPKRPEHGPGLRAVD